MQLKYLSSLAAALFMFAATTVTYADAAADQKAWEELDKSREKIINRIEELRKTYASSDLDGKKKIEAEFKKLQGEYKSIFEKSLALAPKILKNDPENEDAKDVMLGALGDDFQSNRYEEAAKISEELLKLGIVDKFALNIGGASYFATHNFKRAKEMLTMAEEKNMLLPRIGGQYLGLCDQYQKLWETEQKIRAAEKKANDLPQVELITSKGRIVLELFENEAPNSVANFISLVEKGFYDGIAFHRVIPNFMTQGGDPNTLDNNPTNDGQGGPGYMIDCECYEANHRKHFQGSLSMAHAGRNTGGSQFFLTHLPTDHLNGKHTVFGRIIEGIDVNASMEAGDTIKSAKVLRKRKHPYVPKTN